MSGNRSAAEKEHATRVRAMFANISARYDLLNHLLSASFDKRWRQRVATQLSSIADANSRVLDVACGTGDLALTLFEATGARIVATRIRRLEIPEVEISSRMKPDRYF